MIKPISPEDVKEEISFPQVIIETFNELIQEKFRKDGAVIMQKEIIIKLNRKGLTSKNIFENRYLDIESIYDQAGWDVKYDKPSFNESFEPYFVFKKKYPK